MKKFILLLACASLAAACGPSCSEDIHRACARVGCAAKVKSLLAKDPSLAKKYDGRGRLPLDYAADSQTVEALLAAGADVNSKTGAEQASPVWNALQNDRGEVVKALLSHGAKLGNPDDYMNDAVRNGRASAVAALIDSGASATRVEPATGATPLHMAVLNDKIEVAKVLLGKGADANAALTAGAQTMSFGPSGVGTQFKMDTKDAAGATPLSLARSEEMKKLLREHGAH